MSTFASAMVMFFTLSLVALVLGVLVLSMEKEVQIVSGLC